MVDLANQAARAGGDPPKDPVQRSWNSTDESDDDVPPKEQLPKVRVRLADTTPNKQNPKQSLSHKIHFCKLLSRSFATLRHGIKRSRKFKG